MIEEGLVSTISCKPVTPNVMTSKSMSKEYHGIGQDICFLAGITTILVMRRMFLWFLHRLFLFP